MTIQLPATNSPIRSLIDVAQVATDLAPANRQKLPTLPQALNSAANFFANEKGARTLHVICWRADGRIVLERIGRNGNHRIVWVFTK